MAWQCTQHQNVATNSVSCDFCNLDTDKEESLKMSYSPSIRRFIFIIHVKAESNPGSRICMEDYMTFLDDIEPNEVIPSCKRQMLEGEDPLLLFLMDDPAYSLLP